MTHEFLDQHYRDTLDQPVPSLGGKSPRQSVRSAAGKKAVVAWLKLLENRTAGQRNPHLAEYDFSWMWEELALEALRR